MKITTVQMNVSYKNKTENIAAVSTLLNDADSLGEVVLLPELFSTGYLFNDPSEIHTLSESLDDSQTLLALQGLATLHNVLIVAGIAEKTEDGFYNTTVVVNKSGLQDKYRKMALTNVDKQYFSRGRDIVTFEYLGVKFGLAICFDLWFPEIIRQYAEKGVDVLLHPANFGGEQSLHIARARAIENSMFVFTCNRIGSEETSAISGSYCGKSQAISPTGVPLMLCGSDTEVQTITIDVGAGKDKKVIGVNLLEEIAGITNEIIG
ncbi:carbon-nitrogen hydrolase family protein [Moritella sp. F3]|uniref:carbon-nitrogen hydrolase family protein n=1 Tax=Moritella sp. F3 TaxID=2718882 RepID=UPI0018E1BDBA|nr:carbon-nitrogen hydrolase family protein [Moritella sp. F3]GIC75683.1 apolipoprotein N-acyltransferase [Moritella sp. F1]GIC81869.1 apolipoprotein N-acyltransferase [Moritella sp. F3]